MKVPEKIWVSKNQHSGKRVPTKRGRIAYIRESGDGPWGKCDWAPPIKPGQAYF